MADLLTKANLRLSSFINKLTTFGWSEIDAFKKASSSLATLSTQVPETKNLNWSQIDNSTGSAITDLNQAKNNWATRAESESKKLTDELQQKVDAFKPIETTLSSTDWAQIDAITLEAENNRKTCASYLLRPLSPWNCSDAINQVLNNLETKIIQLSDRFVNQTEQLTRQIGLARQTGRKTAMWIEDYKWYLIGSLVLVIFLKGRAG